MPELPLRGGPLKSPAAKYLQSLRSYPNNRGEVSGATNAIQAAITQCQDAGGEILKRVARAKVYPIHLTVQSVSVVPINGDRLR